MKAFTVVFNDQLRSPVMPAEMFHARRTADRLQVYLNERDNRKWRVEPVKDGGSIIFKVWAQQPKTWTTLIKIGMTESIASAAMNVYTRYDAAHAPRVKF